MPNHVFVPSEYDVRSLKAPRARKVKEIVSKYDFAVLDLENGESFIMAGEENFCAGYEDLEDVIKVTGYIVAKKEKFMADPIHLYDLLEYKKSMSRDELNQLEDGVNRILETFNSLEPKISRGEFHLAKEMLELGYLISLVQEDRKNKKLKIKN